MKPIQHHKFRQNSTPAPGFTLVEMAVTLVVFGLIGILFVRWLQLENEQDKHLLQRNLVERADDALLAFTAAHSRLPCPAVDSNGREDCSNNRASGYLPYASLGLPDQRAAAIHYTVQRRRQELSSVDMHQQAYKRLVDVDLTQAINRAQALQVISNQPNSILTHQISTYSTCAEMPQQCADQAALSSNGLDLCSALFDAAQLPPSAQFAHSHVAGKPAEILGNVAYALHLPADPADQPGLGMPMQRNSSTTVDSGQALAVSVEQMWSRLRCGDNHGPAMLTHANLAAAARLTTPAMTNIHEQLAIMDDLATANVLSGAAAITAAGAQVSGATGGLFDTAAETFETYGGWSWRMSVAAGGIGSASTAMVAAIAMVATASIYQERSESLLTHFEATFPPGALLLESEIGTSAKRADMLGIYPTMPVRRATEHYRENSTP